MMKRTITPLAAGCLALSLVLTACGGSGTNTQQQETAEAPQAAEAATEVTTEAAEPAAPAAAEDAKPIDPEVLLGGWQDVDSPVIPAEVQAAFDKAMEGFTGSSYIPVAYLGRQVVSGTNYMLFCRQKMVVPDPVETYAFVTIYEDLQGNATITDVIGTGAETWISDLAGGWQAADSPEVTDAMEDMFDRAIDPVLGLDCDPEALLATQVVSGTNYCFLCEVEPVTSDDVEYYALVSIYEDLQGNVSLLDIRELRAAE